MLNVSKRFFHYLLCCKWRQQFHRLWNCREFIKQSSEIAYKITELRTTRRKILSESENAETIDELSELNAALMESESTENFDEILFENIVKRIFVINNACIKFSLLGGLEATEAIREKERCKNRV